jgi:hypothetical protein
MSFLHIKYKLIDTLIDSLTLLKLSVDRKLSQY